ncbi:choline transporter [Photobacterium swingsii]|uniref:BCCT family transporter n=1 Tax=Photobacterium swingsii TaxID=680026 RepID=A0A0J8V6U7_9GAMM|nr:BCCT family transporter [Photobacterium swingsii]KMV28897.1 choline transporter [Photobacterium swingsii]PSW24663.1 BCCT family transporter [Photobacterium swingsii]
MSFQKDINKPVFFISLVIIALLSFVGVLWPDSAQNYFGAIQKWFVTQASWLYILSVAIFLIFLVFVMCSRMGDIKLGPDHSEPDYTFGSWVAMLFSAGMGIGLMFFGVAEPVMHFMSPPVGDPQTVEAAREAMKITFFHWGLHAWAIYAVVALSLAYFSYRHKLPLLPRSVLHPLIGDKIYGPIGHAVDIFAVIGTLFGVATSLGFGVMQVNAGFNYLFGLPQTTEVQMGLIAVITLFATVSVVLGLDGGIKRLSNINMSLAILLVTIVIIAGPTVLILQSFVQNTGSYLSDIVNKTFNLFAYAPKEDWIGGWTLLYWGWWISWSPFVGMFIARISRGRTIREFLIGVLLLPSLFGFLWFTAFGNTAIDAIMNHGATYLSEAVSSNVPVALFKFFEHMPLSSLLSMVGVLLVITFFVSSSDSGSLVIDTLTSGGAEEPPVWQRIFWALTEGLVAAALLGAGGLSALQTMTIASAFPIMILLLVFCYCLFIALRNDYLLQSSVQNHNTSVQYTKASVSWKDRISSLVNHPKKTEAKAFIDDTAKPALTSLANEMKKQGLAARIQILDPERVRMVIEKEGVEDFAYGIRLRRFVLPTYVNEEQSTYYRAEVFLLQGGQQYDVLGYTQEQIIADAITQYERHMHFLHLATSENVASKVG